MRHHRTCFIKGKIYPSRKIATSTRPSQGNNYLVSEVPQKEICAQFEASLMISRCQIPAKLCCREIARALQAHLGFPYFCTFSLFFSSSSRSSSRDARASFESLLLNSLPRFLPSTACFTSFASAARVSALAGRTLYSTSSWRKTSSPAKYFERRTRPTFGANQYL